MKPDNVLRKALRIFATRAAMCLALMLPCSAAFAINFYCTATMTPMNFGTVDMANGTGMTSGATLSYECRNTGWLYTRNARVCFNIGDGEQGGGNFNPRQMRNAAGNILQFQLYHPNGTVIWGASNNYAIPIPIEIFLYSVPPYGVRTGSVNMVGRIMPNQAPPAPGAYQDVFSGGHTKISLREDGFIMPSDCGVADDGSFPFTVTANVGKSCQVNASDLTFGTVPDPIVATNIASQSTVNVNCTRTTPYTIALSPSNGASNGAGLMSALGAVAGNTDKVPYQLYRDAARTTVWGNQPGVNTASGTGTGLNQAHTVYGRVPSANFTADSYQDIVTVQVAY